MTDDRAELFTSLRASTVALLGYDAEHLTAAQRIRVDRAIALRLVIDEAQAKQMRGEVIDIDEFVSASESLERMVGGQPDAPTSRFDGKARERLRQLIERTVMAGEVDVAECMADIREREEMAAIVAAAPDGWKPASGDARRDSDVPHPSLIEPAAPAGGDEPVLVERAPPQRALTDVEKMNAVNATPALPPAREPEEWRS